MDSLISKKFANKISKVDILPKSFSVSNQVPLMLKKKDLTVQRETILPKKNILKECKEKLNEYFNNNLGKGTDLMTVWEVSNF